METEWPQLAMVMDNDGEFIVRDYTPDLRPMPVELTRVVSDRLQIRVFGARTTEDLTQLRVAIVGCGGTGSAVASLLARIGVSRFVLIDADRVDMTNLNRLHFSTRADAIAGRYKVDVVGDAIAEI